MSTLDVSLVAANYNNSQFLKDFFDSIIKLDHSFREIIIVDDGSNDGSVDIIDKYKDVFSQLKAVYLEKNVGFANALNIATNLVTSRYLFRIDPDDLIINDRLFKQYSFLETNQHVDIVGTNVRYFSDIDRCLMYSNFKTDNTWIREQYKKGEHGVIHGTVMGRSEKYKKYFYKQENVPAEEYDIFSRMLMDGLIFANLAEILTAVRIHGSSVSNSLPFNTVNKTFELREQIWGIRTVFFKRIIAFISKRCYRKYLFESNPIMKKIYLLIASIFNIPAVIRRIRK